MKVIVFVCFLKVSLAESRRRQTETLALGEGRQEAKEQ